MHPEVQLDPAAVELLLAAEIVGHYRSYQVLGPLQERLRPGRSGAQAMGNSMEQELERIFRVMALLLPHAGLHDAYVGLRSSNPTVRGNAIEFLDNVLKPELRQLLVPLLDSSVTVAERIGLANGLVGAPLETPEQAVATLLASEDSWLRSCAVYAIGAMQLEGLEGALDRLAQDQDPAMQQTVEKARRRLAGISDAAAIPVPVPRDHGRRDRVRIGAVGVVAKRPNPHLIQASARLLALVLAGSNHAFEPQRQRRRDAFGTVDQVALEIAVAESHLLFVRLTGPETRARGLVDDRRAARRVRRRAAGPRSSAACRAAAGRPPPSPCLVK